MLIACWLTHNVDLTGIGFSKVSSPYARTRRNVLTTASVELFPSNDSSCSWSAGVGARGRPGKSLVSPLSKK